MTMLQQHKICQEFTNKTNMGGIYMKRCYLINPLSECVFGLEPMNMKLFLARFVKRAA